jgi:hypothetical protein
VRSISFSNYALYKFKVLPEHGLHVSRDRVRDTINSRDHTEHGQKGRKVMPKVLDEQHVLRVKVEQRDSNIVVITFYPATRERYESQV